MSKVPVPISTFKALVPRFLHQDNNPCRYKDVHEDSRKSASLWEPYRGSAGAG